MPREREPPRKESSYKGRRKKGRFGRGRPLIVDRIKKKETFIAVGWTKATPADLRKERESAAL